MLSLDLRQILPPKIPFFCSSKSGNFIKNFATDPEFTNFVRNQYFRHDGQFLSFRSVFRQKRNPLEPSYDKSHI